MVAAVVLAVLGVADAILFGIYTQLVFAVVLAAAAWRARDVSRTALKVMTVVAAIQGILVISFLLFSGESIPRAEVTVAALLVVAAAATTALGSRALVADRKH